MRFFLFPPLFLITILSVSRIGIIPAHSQCLEDQKTLLLRLKSSLTYQSSFSTNLVTWNKKTDCCHWGGVTCNNKTGKVIGLDLNNESIYSGINNSSSLFSLQFLQMLNLAYNRFHFTPIPSQFNNLISLTYLNLSNCGFAGKIPTELLHMTKLVTLDLSTSDFFNGTPSLGIEIPNLSMVVQNLKELTELYLDGVNISVQGFTWWLPNLKVLSMSNCYLTGQIPNSTANLTQLHFLNLSSNMFAGPIPSFRMSKNLTHIDLSHNNLSGPVPSTHFEGLLNLEYVDLQFNSFNGSIPSSLFAIPSLQKIQLSSNNFTGSIPQSICNISYLQVVDLSNNSLSGLIPSCLIELSETLEVLNLAKNNFRGNISWTFSSNCGLKTLDLHRNLLEGKFPASLTNCRKLMVLNLGYNQINDNFPCFLNNSSNLRVLALRANLLHGDIRCGGTTKSWPTLQIIDIASNYFTGNLPPKCFLNPTTMLTIEDDTVSFNFDGQEWEFHRIWTFIVAIDISNNKFEGNIPDTIGELKLLRFLNLSNNLLTGSIPLSIGNLEVLEALDLSSNMLSGPIPPELGNLTFLSFLDLSYNQLTGKVPSQAQFLTLEGTSFMFQGNKGLHGIQVSKICSGAEKGQTSAPNSEEPGSVTGLDINWDFTSVEGGYGEGYVAGLGMVVLPLLFCKRWRKWYYKHADRVVSRIFNRLDQGRRNRRRRAYKNPIRRL